jgi:hypothetical protein
MKASEKRKIAREDTEREGENNAKGEKEKEER